MNAWRQLLLQIVLRHRAQGGIWMTWVLLATLVLPLGGLVSGWMSRPVAALLAGALVSMLTFIWWGMFLQTALRLNTPASACLVPGMRRRLMQVTAVLWIAASLPAAVLFGAAAGHYGFMLLCCAAVLLYVAVTCRYFWLAFLPSAVWAISLLPGYPGGLVDAMLAADQVVLALGGMLVLAALGAAALQLLFPRGGDAHFRISACTARSGRNRKEGRSSVPAGGLMRALDSFYYARLLAPGRPITRLLDALGGRAHWSCSVLIIATLTAGTLGYRAYAGPGTMRPLIPLLLVSMLLTVLTHVDGLLSAVKNSRVEQGILRLTPAAPPTRQLNRQLALALLGRFGIVWGVYLAGSIAVVLATTGAWRAWLCCTVVALAFTPLLLRDHARHPGWKTAQWAGGLLMLVMAPLSGVVEYGRVPLAVVIVGAAVLLAGTAIALVYRWRRAMAAPPAFPAGRLAV